MLPTTHSETPEEASQRQANFIVLRTLESKLPPQLFEQIISQASESFVLPKRIAWTGTPKDLSFNELKVNFRQVDQNYLPQLLQTVVNGPNQQKLKLNSNDQIQTKPSSRSLLAAGKTNNLLLAQKSLHLQNFLADQKKNLIYHQISRFERMKTVFGHALIEEGYNAPIYNVRFDQTGNFVISGADDGIIKIWDRDTLNLQAALHSHEDVITDMDISKCNQYLATSSKDGKVIIWDWQNCRKVEEIAAHNGTVNNIKFFSLKNKNSKEANKNQEEIEILITCSDDGTIKVYDEVSHLNSVVGAGHEGNQRKSRTRNEGQAHKKERFQVVLTPEDFRPGSRNKKIDSVNINHNGLIAAGNERGEILLWELDVSAFKRQQQKSITWLGYQKKAHSKSIHHCEFSPTGKYLFTGSVDGTAKVWNVDKDKSKKNEGGNRIITLEDRLVVTLEEKLTGNQADKNTFFKNVNYFKQRLQRFGESINYQLYKEKKSTWQIDSLTWSAHGRYAIVALSGKHEDRDSKDLSIIKVWDSFTNQTIQDISKGNNVQLMNYSFVVTPHPKIEEIFMSGSDGGIICLWNIKTRSLIKRFLEYGVYSFEKYTMNDPYDGKFSPDGNSFIVGSVMGTISLFSCDPATYKYEATRVEQFFQLDDTKHKTNLYYEDDIQVEPQVCAYNLIPYEVQPPPTLLGRFRNSKKLTHEEYVRQYVVRRDLCLQEEEFIENQLQDGLRNNMFNPDNIPVELLDANNEDSNIQAERRIRPRIGSEISGISHNANQVASQEDVDALNDIRQAERAHPRGRRLNRNDEREPVQSPHFDPENDFYDRDSDENFEMVEDEQESEVSVTSEEEESEEVYGIHTRRNRQANQRQREHQREENKRNSRSERAQRRARMVEEEKTVGTRGNRRRAIIEESEEESEFVNGGDYEMSDVETRGKRRLQKNNGGRNERVELPSSDDESIKSVDEDDDMVSEFGIRTRNAKAKNQKRKSTNAQAERSQVRSLRTRNNRKRYVGMDESSEMQQENGEESETEDKIPPHSKEEEKVGPQAKSRRVVQDESDEEMIDTDMVVPDKSSKTKGDEDYELVEIVNNNQGQEDQSQDANNRHKCAFCYRIDGLLVGPFQKTKGSKQQLKDYKYFHRECIEVNEYSFFSQQKRKWLNIGKALEMFQKKSFMCGRCGMVGATIKCMDCTKHYHGYLCSQLYMIWCGGQSYQCFECRNKINYKTFRDKEPPIDGKEVKKMKRNLQREHLLMSKQTFTTFIPQVGDEIYYFYQGHEKFISFFNCFFYSGDSDRLPFEYPWRQYPDQLESPTLCKIIGMNHRFPSRNALYLIKKYGGQSAFTVQTPQVITQLELQIMNTDDDEDSTFTVEIFPSELPDFLVLRTMYEQALNKFEQLIAEKKLIGASFRARSKDFNKVKVVDIQQKESTCEIATNWESVIYKSDEAHRLRDRGRRGQRREDEDQDATSAMNLWELVFSENGSQEEDEKILATTPLDANDREIILNIIMDFTEKKKDQIKPFMDRVTPQVAVDYRDHVAGEMYMNLIQERVSNSYYRSIHQLFHDFDLIYQNARLYNGEENELSSISRKLTDKMKKMIKLSLNLNDDLNKPKHEETKISINMSKPAGKLTAPSRYESYVTSMEIFKKQELNGSTKPKKEEQKSDLIMIDTRTRPKRTQYNENVVNDFNVQIDASDASDYKITPKTPAPQPVSNGSSGRRLTRNIQRENYNETTTFSTEEKQVDMQDHNGMLLGKRTRSGRQQKVIKQSLNEDEFDQDFDDDEVDDIMPKRQKRVRHH